MRLGSSEPSCRRFLRVPRRTSCCWTLEWLWAFQPSSFQRCGAWSRMTTMTFSHSLTRKHRGSVRCLRVHTEIPDLIRLFAQFLASIAFILQPLGSIASGIILEPLGRKKSMILVNAPHIAGWLLLYYATSLTDLYVAGEIFKFHGRFRRFLFMIFIFDCSGFAWTWSRSVEMTLSRHWTASLNLIFLFQRFYGSADCDLCRWNLPTEHSRHSDVMCRCCRYVGLFDSFLPWQHHYLAHYSLNLLFCSTYNCRSDLLCTWNAFLVDG